MTFEIGLVLAITVVALILFITDKLGPDMVAILVLVTLGLTQLVSVPELFSGFANPAVITVGAVFIIGEGLQVTGVADYVGDRLLKTAGTSEVRLIVLMMATAGVLSAFINNVGATAVFLPVAISISRQTKIPVSKFLIPISFASLMGGNITLIGTPPNILASDILREYTGASFKFFDFAPMGLLILGFGILYMVLIGRHLLPSHRQADLAEHYPVREYLSEIKVLPNSPLVGKTLIESRFGEDYDLTIVGILRNEMPQLALRRTDVIQTNDTLLVKGSLGKILKVHNSEDFQVETDLDHDITLETKETTIAEVVLNVNSNLAGQTLKDIRFRAKYRLSVLALWRHGHFVEGHLGNEPLKPGDVFLVQGRREFINLLRSSPDFLVLEPVPLAMHRLNKAPLALAIFAGLIVIVTFEWLHITVAAVIAALLMILLGVINTQDAYRAVDWRSILLIAGMIPLGVAMEQTNAAKLLADTVVYQLSDFGPLTILMGVYVLALLVTQSLSNAAAIVLLGPIAINIALTLEASPQAFLMAIVIAVSNDYLTPIGHQSNTLVFGPGGYKFTDYTKVGLGLSITYFLLVALVLPYIWPLFP